MMRGLLIALCLTACSPSFQSANYGTNPYYPPPVGSKIILKEPLIIAPGHRRIRRATAGDMTLAEQA
jgi:hypothetical protein